VVSYFTKNYYEYFLKFKESLDKYHIKYHIEELNGEWEWKYASNHKAKFILDCFKLLKMPLLWIDIDAVVHSNLNYFNELIEKDIDMAFYYRDSRELLSGTLFFNYTSISFLILHLWKKESENVNMWDQRNLQHVLCKDDYDVKRVKIDYLSANYCYFDLLKNRLDKNDIIHIKHFQASREFNPNHPIYGNNKIKKRLI